MITGWRHHAESYSRSEAVLFGSSAPIPRSFIALDLEYGPHTWLIGVCVVEGDDRRTVQLWADTPAEERRNLRALAGLLSEHPTLPVLTWGGTCADVPELRKAGKRLKLAKLVDSIIANHLDLYQ